MRKVIEYICDNCEDDGPCTTRHREHHAHAAPRCVFTGKGHWRVVTSPATVPACDILGDAAPDDPPYYTTGDGPECWDAIYALHGAPGCMAHVLKYAWRCGKKPGVPLVADLRKLQNWVGFLLRKETEGNNGRSKTAGNI